MSERTGGRADGRWRPLFVTALVLVSVLGMAFTGPAVALSGVVSLEQPITSDQNSFDVSYDFAETQSAYLVVENEATGETSTRIVETNGTVSVDTTNVGGLSGGDTITATLYSSDTLEVTLDSASRTVEPAVSGSATFDTPIYADASGIGADIDFSGTDSVTVLFSNDDTGETTTQMVSSPGSVSVSASNVGGLSVGNSLRVGVYESSATDNLLAGDTTTVKELPTGSVSFRTPVTDATENVELDGPTFSGTSSVFLTVRNEATGEQYSRLFQSSSLSTSVSVDYLGGLAVGDTLSATVKDGDSGRLLASDTVSVESAGELSVGTTSLTFGNDTLDAGENATVTVSNTGTGSLTLSEIRLGGPDVAAFTVDAGGPLTLAAGDEANVTVTYSRPEAGTDSATLSFIGTSGTTLGTVSLSGTARTMDSADSEPNFDFGTVRVGETDSEQLTIQHDPSAESSLTFSVTLTGEDADAFRIADGERTLAPGESANWTVEYSPTEVGTDTATLVIDDEYSGEELTVTGTAVRSLLTAEPSSVQFPDANVGEMATRTVTATNSGQSSLSVTPRLNSSQFALADGSQFTLAGGESRNLTVTLTRDTRSSQSATLYLDTNDSTAPPAVVSLSSSNIAVDSTIEGSQVTTTARVQNATAGEQTTISVPETPEQDDYELSNVSVTTRTDGDFSVNLTTSSGTLNTTPTMSTGLANNTRRLGNVSVDASVSNENISNVSFVYRVNRSRLDALGTDPEDVSLFRFNETTQVWVEYDTQPVRIGNRTVTLRTVGDGFSEWTAAAKRPDIRVSDASADVSAVTVGDEVSVQVELTNDGGADGVFLTRLLVNGSVVDDRRVTVPDGGTVPVTFTRQFDTAATYRVTVNEVSVGTIEVNEASGEAEVSTPDSNQQQAGNTTDSTGGAEDGETTDDTGGSGPPLSLLFGIGALVVLAAAGGILYASRDGETETQPESGADGENDVIETEGFDEGTGGDDAE